MAASIDEAEPRQSRALVSEPYQVTTVGFRARPDHLETEQEEFLSEIEDRVVEIRVSPFVKILETYAQDDPDAYSYSGGLCLANQGMLEFVEMFKAPIKMLHPLLTATQEGNYVGTENIGGIPFTGVVLAHSNEAEWQSFKNNKNNEAFIDRIYVIKVPYVLRVQEEQRVTTVNGVDQDIVGLHRVADQAEVALLRIREGKLVNVRTFGLHDVSLPDDELLASCPTYAEIVASQVTEEEAA